LDDLLRQLLGLCEVDAEVHALREQLDLYPKMLAEFDRQETDANSKLDRTRKAFERARDLRKGSELEVASRRERIAKYQAQLNQVKTNKEFEAIKEEIKAVEGKIEELDLAGLEALEQEDSGLASVATQEEALQEFLAEASAERKRISEQLSTKTEQLADRAAEHDRLLVQLPEDFREPYALLDEKYPGSALALIVDGSCAGCSMTLVAQRTAEVKRGTVGVRCDNCSRILYDSSMLESGQGTTP